MSLIATAALVALAVAGAPSSADPTATASAPVKVSAGDNFFAPVKAKVAVGGKVKWTNTGKVDHNVTFKGGFASGNFGPGGTAIRKFNKAGKFPYSCTLHAGMTGKVKVSK
jgi:plastocyanin